MAKLISSFVFLLLVRSAFTSTVAVFISLDCGAEASYFDDNDIFWLPDDLYVTGGGTRKAPGTTSRPMSTLRVFPTRKKNCYSMDVTKGERVLVRASFFYGNYDGKSLPPICDLQIDGNHWVTVLTSMDSTVYYEVIYVPKRDQISVCVVQTTNSFLPLMSALEVTSLDSGMYSEVVADLGLFTVRRTAYGSKKPIRNPDNPYDRIWKPAVVSNSITTLTSDSLFKFSNVSNNPPTSVLQSAITVNINMCM